MEVVREIRKVSGRELTIELPEDFVDAEVEILILPVNRDFRSSQKSEVEVKEDITEAMNEVSMMREGKLPEKSARELLSEL
jgi:hypothetical protein